MTKPARDTVLGGPKGTPRLLRSRTARYRSHTGSSQTVLALTLPEPSRVRVRFQSEKRDQARRLPDLISFVDLRREFENPCPHLKTLSLRRSRGFYDHDQRSSEPTVSDSRGRVVRSLGMAQTLLRPEQVDDLVAQYREGATLVELASVFGVNRRTVATHLTRREVTIRRGRFDPSRIHEAADLYLSGLTLVEVGVKVGAGPQAVRRALASHGVVIRPGERCGSRITASTAVGG